MNIAPQKKSRLILRLTVLVPLVALWFPIHNLLGIEVHSKPLDVVLMILLLALVAKAATSRNINVVNLEKIAGDLRDKNIELNFSHDLVSQIDIETRREVGAWLHGQVQSFHLSMARRMRSADSQRVHELADELDEFSQNTIRSFSHRLYPPMLEVSLDSALSDLLEGRATYKISEELSSLDSTIENLRILPFRVRYVLYRIVEECVANAEKKSLTKDINVELLLKHDTIEVIVTDDGGPVSTPLVGGLGMRLIQDYLASLGGTFSLTTFGPGARFVAQFELIEKVAE